MRRKARNKYLEQRLARAYVLLLVLPEDEDGLRTVSLDRYGHYDVRLVEFAHDNPVTADKSLWVELYAHDCQAVLDSCRPDEFEDAVIATEELISQARQLDEERSSQFESSTMRPKSIPRGLIGVLIAGSYRLKVQGGRPNSN